MGKFRKQIVRYKMGKESKEVRQTTNERRGNDKAKRVGKYGSTMIEDEGTLSMKGKATQTQSLGNGESAVP